MAIVSNWDVGLIRPGAEPDQDPADELSSQASLKKMRLQEIQGHEDTNSCSMPPPSRGPSVCKPPVIQQDEAEKDNSPVKTPYSDWVVGLPLSSIMDELNLEEHIMPTEMHVSKFLKDLSTKQIFRPERRQMEPFVTTVVTQTTQNLHCPFLIVEGKSALGRTLSEAEDQASVPAACGLKVMLDMRENIEGPQDGLFDIVLFSICTQGGILVLYGHYTVKEKGVRLFHTVALKSCYLPIEDEALEWLKCVHNVINYGIGKFKQEIGKYLRTHAKRANL